MSDDLEIHDLSVSHGRRVILQGITTARLHPGTVLAVIGPNGAGKSTFLRALAGLLPSTGVLRHGGRALRALSRVDHARRIGFVPQHLASRSDLPVIESMITALGAGGIVSTDQEALDLSQAALARLDILSLAMRPISRLSGGEAQMVALAMATAHAPPILLLDEPASALDPSRVWMLGEALAARRKLGGITILILHDFALAADWADRILVLKQGQLLAEGPPEAVITPGVLSEAFAIRASTFTHEGALRVRVEGLI